MTFVSLCVSLSISPTLPVCVWRPSIVVLWPGLNASLDCFDFHISKHLERFCARLGICMPNSFQMRAHLHTHTPHSTIGHTIHSYENIRVCEMSTGHVHFGLRTYVWTTPSPISHFPAPNHISHLHFHCHSLAHHHHHHHRRRKSLQIDSSIFHFGFSTHQLIFIFTCVRLAFLWPTNSPFTCW